MSSDEELSVRVYEVLDQVGYSQSMVQQRREAARERDVIMNGKREETTQLTAGSKGEGFAAPFESDTDRVFLYNYAVCRKPGNDSMSLPDTQYEFTMDGEHCHPGHFRQELIHKGTKENSNIQQALFVNDKSRTLISSELYRTSFIEDKTKETVSGPALTGSDENQSWDMVYALRCTSQQQLLSEWISRPRQHNWPTPDLVAEASKLEAQMVPVGCKSSEHKDIEWRVCFIPSEQRLTDSWDENQYKIYILLKLITKSQLKPISDEISSFLLKNIMLWYTEQNPTEMFQTKNLLQNVISCLRNLQEAIKVNQLPYYMIPGRNLLTGRISPEQQQQLITKLDELIQEGPCVVLRCPKVHAALEMSPAALAEKGSWRDEVEKLFLKTRNIWWTHWRPDMKKEEIDQIAQSDPQYMNVREGMCDLLWPQWREYQGDDRRDILNKKRAEALA
ncbi:uncharacterized protein LOC128211933 isoform X2 [Mya arenaria]|nr:uncharacterized protein LOC128211933 isoform X2 [Mya arenaria]XP_052773042.1 uncharacterized protein LOC128211933 isoform X2 [Mya arenaria]XP_052773043.1 uncharacterized protein LOC128211933 isoform X2 [Mya arenaria]XP_052773044.1 uncharacterized protein LOC128211933 isoform X2 [Mya arenaria]